MSEPGLADALCACIGSLPGNGAASLTDRKRPLDGPRLIAALADNPLVDRVVVLQTTDSTNDEVRRRARHGAAQGLVVLADRQRDGRGRRGRGWHSPAGLGLYVSVLLRPAVPAERVTRWTLGASVAACEACRALARCEVDIEWPNDLMLRGRKVGGILTELRSAGGRARDLVIGVGFNVHHEAEDWPTDLAGKAISLRQAAPCGIVVGRERLAVAYLRALHHVVGALERGQWERVAARWSALAPHARGAPVEVLRPEASGTAMRIAGVTAGLDASGALQVRGDDGRVVSVRSAERVRAREG